MGNSVAKKYDVPKDHTSSAGHLRLWKIWPAKAKEDNKAGNIQAGQSVSVWTFDKSELAKKKDKNGATYDKNVIEQIYQVMKKDLAVMKESQASPNMISCLEVIEESKSGLVFTTERIICSLADILYNFEDIPSGRLAHTDFFDDGDSVSEMEISRALLTLSEGIQYMNNVQRRFHLNINPESIVITSSGQWKLCGFGFSLTYQQGDQQRIASPYFLKPPSGQVTVRLEPDARYSAPELSEGGYNPSGVRFVSAGADLFSLALSIYEVYKFNLASNGYERSSFKPMVALLNNDITHHYAALEGAIRSIDVSFLPSGIDRILTGLLSLSVQHRMGALDVTSNQYFITGNLGTLHNIENLYTRDLGTQTSQLLSFIQVVNRFPPRLIKFIILPSIGKLCVANPTLWEYALPLFRLISRLVPNDLYRSIAGNYIAAGLTNNTSTESMLAFLSFVPFLLESFDTIFFQTHATTLFVNSLEKPHPLVQNAAFERLWDDQVIMNINDPPLTEKLVPAICKEACKNMDYNVKAQALFVLSLFARKIAKDYIIANILPSLKYIMDNDRVPAVSMAVVGCYQAFSDSLGPDYISSAVLPTVLPMLIDRSLDRKQFETIVDLVKKLLKKLTEKRTMELNMDAINFGDRIDAEVVDPFAAAKTLLNNTRSMLQHQRDAFDQKLADIPPPLPSMPPPPPPSGPPPPPPSMPPPDSPAGGHKGFSFEPPSYGAPYSAPIVPAVAPPPPMPISSFPAANPIPFTAASSSLLSPAPAVSSFASSSLLTPTPAVTNSVAPKPAEVPSKPSDSSSSSSVFSWFSSKPKASTESSSADATYEPPVVPIPPSNPTPSTSQNTGDTLDLDDFMSSFSHKAKPPTNPAPQQPSVPTANSSLSSFSSAPLPLATNSSYSPPVTQGVNPPANSQTASNFAFLNSSISATPSSTSSVPALSNNMNQLSLEQQLKQTQAEIARLSSSLNTTPAPVSAPMTTSNAFPNQSINTAPSNQPLASQPSSMSSSSGFPFANTAANPPNSSFPQTTGSYGSSAYPGQQPSYNAPSTQPSYGISSSQPPYNASTSQQSATPSPYPGAQPQQQSYNHQFVTSYFGPSNPQQQAQPVSSQPAVANNFSSGYSGNPNPQANMYGGQQQPQYGGYPNPSMPQSYGGTQQPPAYGMQNSQSIPAAGNYSKPATNQFYSNYSTGQAVSGNVGTLPTAYQPPVLPPQQPYNSNAGYLPPSSQEQENMFSEQGTVHFHRMLIRRTSESSCCSDECSLAGTLSVSSECSSAFEEEKDDRRRKDSVLDQSDEEEEFLTESYIDGEHVMQNLSSLALNQQSRTDLESRVQANTALFRFITKYNLPIQVVEDPLFQNVVRAIHSTREPYKPDLGIQFRQATFQSLSTPSTGNSPFESRPLQ